MAFVLEARLRCASVLSSGATTRGIAVSGCAPRGRLGLTCLSVLLQHIPPRQLAQAGVSAGIPMACARVLSIMRATRASASNARGIPVRGRAADTGSVKR